MGGVGQMTPQSEDLPLWPGDTSLQDVIISQLFIIMHAPALQPDTASPTQVQREAWVNHELLLNHAKRHSLFFLLQHKQSLLFRTAVHCSLFALYGLGGWLVQRKLVPIRVLLSAIGFTFSLVFATQGVVQTLADTRKVTSSLHRYCHFSI